MRPHSNVKCPRCGVRVEDFPWAEPWARVTTALFNAVAVLARELSWQGTFTAVGQMGKRRRQTLQVVCMDMWAAYAKLVRDHAVNAQILFDRFHIVKHLNETVDAACRELWRQLTSKQRVSFKGTRWLLRMRRTLCGEMLSTTPSASHWRANSAQSHCDKLRPRRSGISQAILTKCGATPGENFGFAPGRGRSSHPAAPCG
jgi:hypothetical protein